MVIVGVVQRTVFAVVVKMMVLDGAAQMLMFEVVHQWMVIDAVAQQMVSDVVVERMMFDAVMLMVLFVVVKRTVFVLETLVFDDTAVTKAVYAHVETIFPAAVADLGVVSPNVSGGIVMGVVADRWHGLNAIGH